MESFSCPYCGLDQRVSRGSWELVFAQILMHFSTCAPPSRFPDTDAILREAERIANLITSDAR